ncbi:MAG: dephospho-CoA kinase [Ignavibacteriaceae bacterium]|nr:dephospho-CoA kinase [Ignavibacteriaceae bacterium]
MSKKTFTVAITGGIGSGKSTFSEFLRQKDYPVIFADDISKELLLNNKEVKNEIIELFGSSAFNKSDINTDFLAKEVFSDPLKLQKINSVLHPKVIEQINQEVKELKNINKLVFVEAALIYEANIEKLFDYVVLITADEEIKRERTVSSNKFSSEEFDKRTQNQITDEEKSKRADFIFFNNTTKNDLKIKANLLLMTLNSLLK